MAIEVSPACAEPVLRHGRFEVWVVLRRARAESLRAGESLHFPIKPNICPPLSLFLSSLRITLQWGSGPYMSQVLMVNGVTPHHEFVMQLRSRIVPLAFVARCSWSLAVPYESHA